MIGRLITLVAVFAVAACSVDRRAAPVPIPPPSSASKGFDHVDQDGDAVVSQAEWDGHAQTTFTTLDSDASGILTDVEMSEGFSAFDIDGDGVLTPEEVDAPELDLDGDGVISREEWVQANVIDKYDTDGDGRVSDQEFRKRRTSAFEAYDADLNQTVDRIELDPASRRFTVFKF
ncbi:MAG: EF-hand domain-containing protein [Pseudomonadota bacterium]